MDSNRVAHELNEILGGLLGMDPGTQLDPAAPMESMGLDSLLAIDFIVALESKFGIKLKDTVHVDHPTINELAAHISKQTSKVA